MRNRILAGLTHDQIDRLWPHLVQLDLPQGMMLVKPDAKVEYLHFLEHGLASIVALSATGRSFEVAVTGREGLVGFYALLGEPRTSNMVMMQGAGAGYRIRAAMVQQEVGGDADFLRSFHGFLEGHIAQISQSVLCNRLHEAEPRLARWLLMASDHMETEYLVLTQEFISQMLGSTRSTVTITAGQLQERDLITYSRGKIRILDRAGLEQCACECYTVVRGQYAPGQVTLGVGLATKN